MRTWIIRLLSGLFFLILGSWILWTHDTSHTIQPAVPLNDGTRSWNNSNSIARSLIPKKSLSIPTNTSVPWPIASQEMEIPVGLRLMVFSPHPDDETLAAGGLIQRVLEKGGSVRVVFVTNGDGYTEGVRTSLKEKNTSSNDFIEYGEKRHDEALGALRALGLQPENGIFLGFPDDGIDDLWSQHWSSIRPYTSPYTRYSRPEYKERFSRWTEYAGMDLKEEISRTLEGFIPDWIVLPDPRDYHPDHCTTGVFVLDAVRQLNEKGDISFSETKIFTYLVHYFDYPSSNQWIKEISVTGIGGTRAAGKVLASAQWYNLHLTANELEGKKRALAAHHTQIQVLGEFLKEFMRSDELFCQLSSTQTLNIPIAYAARFKRSRS